MGNQKVIRNAIKREVFKKVAQRMSQKANDGSEVQEIAEYWLGMRATLIQHGRVIKDEYSTIKKELSEDKELEAAWLAKAGNSFTDIHEDDIAEVLDFIDEMLVESAVIFSPISRIARARKFLENLK